MVAAFITEPLVVDPVVHAAEIARFQAKVVEGPGEYCAIWTGAIADDGYGRFSITRQGRFQRARFQEKAIKGGRMRIAEIFELGHRSGDGAKLLGLQLRVGIRRAGGRPTRAAARRAPEPR